MSDQPTPHIIPDSAPSMIRDTMAVDPYLTEPIERAGESVFEEMVRPYHIHFAKGAEGYELNPGGAEYNFDAVLMLTQRIHEFHGTGRQRLRDSSSLNWFFERYPNTDIQQTELGRPLATISKWLSKLGPHNDMAEAQDDLEMARDVLTQDDREDADPDYESRRYSVVAELDIELAQIYESDPQRVYMTEDYLQDAQAHLEHNLQANEANLENYGRQALDRVLLSSVRIDLERLRLFGTTLPIDHAPENMKAELTEFTQAQADELKTELENLLSLAEEDYARATEVEPDEEALRYHWRRTAYLFEGLTYLKLLGESIFDDTAHSTRIQPGTFRQEQGAVHNVITSDNKPKRHTFNYNFDLQVTTANDLGERPRVSTLYAPHEDEIITGDEDPEAKGLYTTTYVQMKLHDSLTPALEFKELAEKNLFPGKHFIFLVPDDYLIAENLGQPTDDVPEIIRIVDEMRRYLTEDYK